MLITQQEIINSIEVDDHLSVNRIKDTAITKTELLLADEVLGQSFYLDLCNKKRSVGQFSDPNYNTLYNLYLKRLLAEWIVLRHCTTLILRITNEGLENSSKLEAIKAYKEELSGELEDSIRLLKVFLEKNKGTYSLYSGNVVAVTKKRETFGGFYLEDEDDEIIIPVPKSVSYLPSCYTEIVTSSSNEWIISYGEKVLNEYLVIERALDHQGNDITDYIQPVWNRDAQTVMINFIEGAFISENKTGQVTLCTQKTLDGKNVIRGMISIDDEYNNAYFELLEGNVYSPEYKWYFNDTLLGTGFSANVSELPVGILFLELWENGEKILRVFETILEENEIVV